MAESAIRKDIAEVTDIVKGFMGQVSDQIADVNKRIDSLAAQDLLKQLFDINAPAVRHCAVAESSDRK